MRRLLWNSHVMTAATYLLPGIVSLLITAPLAGAQALEHVHSFSSGSHPDTSLIQGTDGFGFLYGTTGGNGNDTVFRIRPDGTGFETIYSLNCAADGCAAQDSIGGLVQLADGYLYGTRSTGGSPNSAGTIFRLKPDPVPDPEPGTAPYSHFEVIHVFQQLAASNFELDPFDGRFPLSGLVQLDDGFLYGTTPFGGMFDKGTVFRILPDGSAFSIVHAFSCAPSFACAPIAGLTATGLSDLVEPDILYGTTAASAGIPSGGTFSGTIYRVSPDGAAFAVIHEFIDPGAGLGIPQATLILGSDGFLYGTRADAGAANTGTLFKIWPDGTQFLSLHTFQGGPSDGGQPIGGLVQLSDNNFYGTTARGGTVDCGTVFRIAANGGNSFFIIDSFGGSNNSGCFPGNSLIQASDGNLYGTAPSGGPGGTIFRVPFSGPAGQAPAITSANSATFTAGSLWSFTVTTTGTPTATLSKTGTLPAGVTFTDNGNGTATLGGKAAAPTASYQIDITASNGTLPNATQIFTLTVNASFKADKSVSLGANVIIGAGTQLDKNVRVGDDAIIGSNVRISQNVDIRSGVRIGNATTIDQGTIVGANAHIGAGVRIGQRVTVAANATIPDGTIVRAGTSVP